MIRNTRLRKSVAFLSIITLLTSITFINPSVMALDNDKDNKMAGFNRENTYQNYIEKYKNTSSPIREIIIPAQSFISNKGAQIEKIEQFEGARNIIKWTNQDGMLEWTTDIPEEGLYNIAFKYYPLSGKNNNIELELDIDGTAPFSSAERFTFTKIWKDANQIKRDSRDNDINPSQIEAPMWIEKDFSDNEGLYNDAYKFYLSKGKHTISLKASRACFAAEYLKIYNEPANVSYKDAYENYKKQGYKESKANELIKIQAENSYLKSDSMLHPMYDRSDPSTEPSHPTKMRLNTIGQLNWQYQGQWISWKFSVPEDGLYKIGMRARQNFIRGVVTSRRIYIDGKVPFKEMESVEFAFNENWYMKVLGDKDPYQFYLTKGEHEIKMEVVPGETSQSIRVIEDSIYKLNYLYRKIIMITSTKPDPYRDYYLENQIPDLLKNFGEIKNALSSEKQHIERVSEQKGSEAVSMQKLAVQLESFINKPDTIPVRLEDFQKNISGLSEWLMKLKEQPLELDYIVVVPPDKSFPKMATGFFNKLKYDIKAFLGSFTEDYNSIGNVYDKDKAITVWVGLGRDQVQLIKEMVDNYFVPQTGIQVNVSFVQQGLIQATLAGKGPDVALFISPDDTINLSSRGALTDISKYSDFKKTTEQFMPEAMVPYEYRGGYYALPVTQIYPMMFYRKDIFNELGIKVPGTWDDFYKVLPVIQRNNMSIGIPSTSMNVGVQSTTIFESLLMQRGGKYYNDKRSATGFDSPEALEAFKQWTGFYTRYSFPLTYDFYSRFRTGEMPLAIDNYTMYNELTAAAPEIKNLWDIAPLPGTKQKDGTIDKSVSSSGTSCIIFKKTENQDGAWQFIKWFTSADVQSQFGRSLEALMGPAARYETANVDAFKQLPWTKKESDKLLEQWKQVRGVPQTPASYYIGRNLSNAFRKVQYYWENPREMLNNYNRDMNKEIKRKRIEFGIDN